jgi:hypothetical protein
VRRGNLDKRGLRGTKRSQARPAALEVHLGADDRIEKSLVHPRGNHLVGPGRVVSRASRRRRGSDGDGNPDDDPD